MANRKQFTEWLQEIDPAIQFDDIDQRTLFIAPSDDSPLLDQEAMFDIDSPEMFQFLAGYVREFGCMWQYKNTQLWREGDVWGLSHTFPNKTAIHLSLVDSFTDLAIFEFIILLNDNVLPSEVIDDSPIKPNPFDTAMSVVDWGMYNNLNPLAFGSYTEWMDEAESTASDEPDIFFADDDDQIPEIDWQWARKDAEGRIVEWFNDYQENYTPQMVEDALEYLRDCGLEEESESIQDLLAKLGEQNAPQN